MDIATLQALGITTEDIIERIVDASVTAILRSVDGYDEDSEPVEMSSKLSKRVQEMAMKRIDARIDQLANDHLIPKLDAMIDNLVLQQTTQWGEKKGQPMSVIEYLVDRANSYMAEPVDINGKSKSEADSYNWRQHSTRIVHAINAHLQYHIKAAMETALKTANSTMAKGLHEACRVAINEAAEKFAVVVKQG